MVHYVKKEAVLNSINKSTNGAVALRFLSGQVIGFGVECATGEIIRVCVAGSID